MMCLRNSAVARLKGKLEHRRPPAVTFLGHLKLVLERVFAQVAQADRGPLV